MKDPFVKEDHTGLIIGLAVGATAGIALGWLFLSDKGADYRRQISRKFKEAVSDQAAEEVAKAATDAVIKD
jgi:gas vesicle protein